MMSDKIERRINSLTKKHKELDKEVEQMYNNNSFNDDTIHEMKKQKLYLKDEINNLQQQLGEANG